MVHLMIFQAFGGKHLAKNEEKIILGTISRPKTKVSGTNYSIRHKFYYLFRIWHYHVHSRRMHFWMNVIEIMKWFNFFEGFFQTPASSVFMHPDLFKIFNYFINITFSNINHLNTGIILLEFFLSQETLS